MAGGEQVESGEFDEEHAHMTFKEIGRIRQALMKLAPLLRQPGQKTRWEMAEEAWNEANANPDPEV